MAEMVLRIVRRDDRTIGLWVHTKNDPPMDEWNASLGEIERMKASDPNILSTLSFLVATDGGGPNQVQRAMLFTKLLEKRAVPVAGLSSQLNSRVVRGIATAVTWVNPGFKVFPPAQWQDALVHIQRPNDTELIRTLFSMELQVARPLDTLGELKALVKG